MKQIERVAAVLLGIVICALAFFGILTLTRGTPVQMVITDGPDAPPAVTDSLFERTLELYTGTHIFAGNVVEQLLNGNETYPRLWADLRGARSTITFQTYYSEPGAVADTLAAILKERAAAHVRVLLLLDAFGSQAMPRGWITDLRRAGVEVLLLRKLKWYRLHAAANRSHVRLAVIDGRIGYTGGFGIADQWLGDGVHADGWRDTNVRLEGPSVMAVQSAFTAAWAEASGELLTGKLFFPPTGFLEQGPVHAGLLFSKPTNGSTPAERFLALSFAAARSTLYIANSYFVPDDDFRRLLIEAASRGVDVRVLTAGAKTDIKTTRYAGRYRYEELLAGGVKIYEYVPTMMHAKTFIVDGRWGTIGSMNFDNRSMVFNDESNEVFLDPILGAQMDAAFQDDLTHATEIHLDSWGRRGEWERMLERGAALLQRIL
jgi:cardiolipin synthase